MSLAQRLVRLLSKQWAAALEAESRQWMVICPCGHERSVWEIGGIRYKAAGSPRWWMRCPKCGERRWHTVIKRETPNPPEATAP